MAAAGAAGPAGPDRLLPGPARGGERRRPIRGLLPGAGGERPGFLPEPPPGGVRPGDRPPGRIRRLQRPPGGPLCPKGGGRMGK